LELTLDVQISKVNNPGMKDRADIPKVDVTSKVEPLPPVESIDLPIKKR
jgi:hypothetical protein